MYEQYEQNPVIKTVRTMLTSPLFLVGAIGYSVYVLFELFGGIMGGSEITRLMNRIFELSGGYSMNYGYDYMQTYMSAFNGIRVMGALIVTIPAILIAVGMWLSFVSAKNKENQNISVTGLMIIRVIVIIQLVCMCIGAVVLELVCILAMSGVNAAMSYYSSDAYVTGIFVGIMIGIAVGAAVRILYFLKLGKTVNGMKEVVLSGRPNVQVSLYVEIFCYVMGGICAFSAFVSLAGLSVYEFLANAGLSTSDIVFGIFLRKYRKNMEMLAQGQVPQGYQGQAQNYQNQEQSYQEAQYQGQAQSYQAPAQPQYQGQAQSYQAPAQPQYQAQPQGSQVQPQGSRIQQYQQENETTVLPYYNETSVLSGQFMSGGQMKLVRMTRQKTGETICISKLSFWIGKDAANVDYCITDNTAVSRRHALVTIQNNNCYVRDNHSTNRVFLNGQMIQPDTDTLLSDGDRVRMGDEEFVVSIG